MVAVAVHRHAVHNAGPEGSGGLQQLEGGAGRSGHRSGRGVPEVPGLIQKLTVHHVQEYHTAVLRHQGLLPAVAAGVALAAVEIPVVLAVEHHRAAQVGVVPALIRLLLPQRQPEGKGRLIVPGHGQDTAVLRPLAGQDRLLLLTRVGAGVHRVFQALWDIAVQLQVHRIRTGGVGRGAGQAAVPAGQAERGGSSGLVGIPVIALTVIGQLESAVEHVVVGVVQRTVGALALLPADIVVLGHPVVLVALVGGVQAGSEGLVVLGHNVAVVPCAVHHVVVAPAAQALTGVVFVGQGAVIVAAVGAEQLVGSAGNRAVCIQRKRTGLCSGAAGHLSAEVVPHVIGRVALQLLFFQRLAVYPHAAHPQAVVGVVAMADAPGLLTLNEQAGQRAAAGSGAEQLPVYVVGQIPAVCQHIGRGPGDLVLLLVGIRDLIKTDRIVPGVLIRKVNQSVVVMAAGAVIPVEAAAHGGGPPAEDAVVVGVPRRDIAVNQLHGKAVLTAVEQRGEGFLQLGVVGGGAVIELQRPVVPPHDGGPLRDGLAHLALAVLVVPEQGGVVSASGQVLPVLRGLVGILLPGVALVGIALPGVVPAVQPKDQIILHNPRVIFAEAGRGLRIAAVLAGFIHPLERVQIPVRPAPAHAAVAVAPAPEVEVLVRQVVTGDGEQALERLCAQVGCVVAQRQGRHIVKALQSSQALAGDLAVLVDPAVLEEPLARHIVPRLVAGRPEVLLARVPLSRHRLAAAQQNAGGGRIRIRIRHIAGNQQAVEVLPGGGLTGVPFLVLLAVRPVGELRIALLPVGRRVRPLGVVANGAAHVVLAAHICTHGAVHQGAVGGIPIALMPAVEAAHQAAHLAGARDIHAVVDKAVLDRHALLFTHQAAYAADTHHIGTGIGRVTGMGAQHRGQHIGPQLNRYRHLRAGDIVPTGFVGPVQSQQAADALPAQHHAVHHAALADIAVGGQARISAHIAGAGDDAVLRHAAVGSARAGDAAHRAAVGMLAEYRAVPGGVVVAHSVAGDAAGIHPVGGDGTVVRQAVLGPAAAAAHNAAHIVGVGALGDPRSCHQIGLVVHLDLGVVHLQLLQLPAFTVAHRAAAIADLAVRLPGHGQGNGHVGRKVFVGIGLVDVVLQQDAGIAAGYRVRLALLAHDTVLQLVLVRPVAVGIGGTCNAAHPAAALHIGPADVQVAAQAVQPTHNAANLLAILGTHRIALASGIGHGDIFQGGIALRIAHQAADIAVPGVHADIIQGNHVRRAVHAADQADAGAVSALHRDIFKVDIPDIALEQADDALVVAVITGRVRAFHADIHDIHLGYLCGHLRDQAHARLAHPNGRGGAPVFLLCGDLHTVALDLLPGQPVELDVNLVRSISVCAHGELKGSGQPDVLKVGRVLAIRPEELIPLHNTADVLVDRLRLVLGARQGQADLEDLRGGGGVQGPVRPPVGVLRIHRHGEDIAVQIVPVSGRVAVLDCKFKHLALSAGQGAVIHGAADQIQGICLHYPSYHRGLAPVGQQVRVLNGPHLSLQVLPEGEEGQPRRKLVVRAALVDLHTAEDRGGLKPNLDVLLPVEQEARLTVAQLRHIAAEDRRAAGAVAEGMALFRGQRTAEGAQIYHAAGRPLQIEALRIQADLVGPGPGAAQLRPGQQAGRAVQLIPDAELIDALALLGFGVGIGQVLAGKGVVVVPVGLAEVDVVADTVDAAGRQRAGNQGGGGVVVGQNSACVIAHQSAGIVGGGHHRRRRPAAGHCNVSGDLPGQAAGPPGAYIQSVGPVGEAGQVDGAAGRIAALEGAAVGIAHQAADAVGIVHIGGGDIDARGKAVLHGTAHCVARQAAHAYGFGVLVPAHGFDHRVAHGAVGNCGARRIAHQRADIVAAEEVAAAHVAVVQHRAGPQNGYHAAVVGVGLAGSGVVHRAEILEHQVFHGAVEIQEQAVGVISAPPGGHVVPVFVRVAHAGDGVHAHQHIPHPDGTRLARLVPQGTAQIVGQLYLLQGVDAAVEHAPEAVRAVPVGVAGRFGEVQVRRQQVVAGDVRGRVPGNLHPILLHGADGLPEGGVNNPLAVSVGGLPVSAGKADPSDGIAVLAVHGHGAVRGQGKQNIHLIGCAYRPLGQHLAVQRKRGVGVVIDLDSGDRLVGGVGNGHSDQRLVHPLNPDLIEEDLHLSGIPVGQGYLRLLEVVGGKALGQDQLGIISLVLFNHIPDDKALAVLPQAELVPLVLIQALRLGPHIVGADGIPVRRGVVHFVREVAHILRIVHAAHIAHCRAAVGHNLLHSVRAVVPAVAGGIDVLQPSAVFSHDQGGGVCVGDGAVRRLGHSAQGILHLFGGALALGRLDDDIVYHVHAVDRAAGGVEAHARADTLSGCSNRHARILIPVDYSGPALYMPQLIVHGHTGHVAVGDLAVVVQADAAEVVIHIDIPLELHNKPVDHAVVMRADGAGVVQLHRLIGRVGGVIAHHHILNCPVVVFRNGRLVAEGRGGAVGTYGIIEHLYIFHHAAGADPAEQRHSVGDLQLVPLEVNDPGKRAVAVQDPAALDLQVRHHHVAARRVAADAQQILIGRNAVDHPVCGEISRIQGDPAAPARRLHRQDRLDAPVGRKILEGQDVVKAIAFDVQLLVIRSPRLDLPGLAGSRRPVLHRLQVRRIRHHGIRAEQADGVLAAPHHLGRRPVLQQQAEGDRVAVQRRLLIQLDGHAVPVRRGIFPVGVLSHPHIEPAVGRAEGGLDQGRLRAHRVAGQEGIAAVVKAHVIVGGIAAQHCGAVRPVGVAAPYLIHGAAGDPADIVGHIGHRHAVAHAVAAVEVQPLHNAGALAQVFTPGSAVGVVLLHDHAAAHLEVGGGYAHVVGGGQISAGRPRHLKHIAPRIVGLVIYGIAPQLPAAVVVEEGKAQVICGVTAVNDILLPWLHLDKARGPDIIRGPTGRVPEVGGQRLLRGLIRCVYALHLLEILLRQLGLLLAQVLLVRRQRFTRVTDLFALRIQFRAAVRFELVFQIIQVAVILPHAGVEVVLGQDAQGGGQLVSVAPVLLGNPQKVQLAGNRLSGLENKPGGVAGVLRLGIAQGAVLLRRRVHAVVIPLGLENHDIVHVPRQAGNAQRILGGLCIILLIDVQIGHLVAHRIAGGALMILIDPHGDIAAALLHVLQDASALVLNFQAVYLNKAV